MRRRDAEEAERSATGDPGSLQLDTDAGPPEDDYLDWGFERFLPGRSSDSSEARGFSTWVERAKRDGRYTFEAVRRGRAGAEADLTREDGAHLHVLNFSSYDYLGYGNHPEVIGAAKAALDAHGLGAGGSPVLGGTLAIHKQLERRLLEFLGLPGRGVSLFSSGYAANLGALAACASPRSLVVLDRAAHASLVEGARLSGALVSRFRHNDPGDLDRVLARSASQQRIVVCVEALYSADGDFAPLRELARVAKARGARFLVDEAHSMLVAGRDGRGVCEEQEVLAEVDLIVVTFSKAFGGVGGAVVARADLAQYINFYARCRMFSCAMDPAAAGGAAKALELANDADGRARRTRIHENTARMRARLAGRLDLLGSAGWIVPILYRQERLTLPLVDFMQRRGLDIGPMQFPAVPRGRARLRLFVTSEHSEEQLAVAAGVILEAAERFDFRA